MYQQTIAGARWKPLKAKGAKPQRLLWASTGTKDPRYPDTLYVDALIGPDTVNTVPPATLTAFMDHGKPAAALARDLEEAHRQIEAFAALELDLGQVCARPARRRREVVRDLDDHADAGDRRAASGAAGEQRGECAMTAIAMPASIPNPLREGLAAERIPEPATMVIFGASGDLTKRKLLPALYSLTRERHAARALRGHRLRAPPDVRRRVPRRDARRLRGVRAPPSGRPRRVGRLRSPTCSIKPASYDDPKAFVALRERLEQIERTLGLPGNRVFYLSIPPSSFATVVRNLGVSGLVPPPSAPADVAFSRVIIEKPFGTDLATAQKLNHDIHETLTEKQIYRIDHYLGKETVQNLLVFRFANGIFEPVWNNRYVDHVQITGAETVGVEGRGGYFEQAGHPARHGPEPPVPGREPGGDGAAGRAGRRRGARRKAQGPQGAAAHPFK